jgi:outer membrane protein assembly factor BamB
LLTDGTIYTNGFGISQEGLMTFEADVKHRGTATIGSDGTIYAVDYEIDYSNDPRRPIQHVYALNANGDVNWVFTIDKGTEEGYFKRPASPAVADDGTVYVGAPDGKFYAINSKGMKLWSFQTGSGIYSSAAIASTGTIYFGSFDGYLYALTPDGNREWAFEVGYRISASPAISEDGTIYITSQASDLYAINPDGSLKI